MLPWAVSGAYISCTTLLAPTATTRVPCRGLFSDADKYKLDFLSEKLTLDDKLILLSSVLFIDYLFFEGA
jgi:hypothetical protein